jgi:hypothetical protein
MEKERAREASQERDLPAKKREKVRAMKRFMRRLRQITPEDRLLNGLLVLTALALVVVVAWKIGAADRTDATEVRAESVVSTTTTSSTSTTTTTTTIAAVVPVAPVAAAPPPPPPPAPATTNTTTARRRTTTATAPRVVAPAPTAPPATSPPATSPPPTSPPATSPPTTRPTLPPDPGEN